MRDETIQTQGSRAPERRVLALVGAAVLIFVVGLTWSKWMPYADKIDVLSGTHAWERGALVDTAREASGWWAGAWAFTLTYTEAVWKALLVGLLLAAAIDAFLPHAWLRRPLGGRGTLTGAATAGAASLPSMMCTCCASPVAVSLRRTGVPIPSAVAYWLGNPVLNPAVLVFLALVGPWQWTATRLAVGVSPWVLGLVLIALPAVSLPSLLMVGRALTWRVTGATAVVVAAAGAVAGGVLVALG